MPYDPPTWLWIAMGIAVWFVLAFALGVTIGRVVRAADQAEQHRIPPVQERAWRR